MTEAEKRRMRWVHCSYIGHTARMRVAAATMRSALTTTDETKEIAAQIELLAIRLAESLKNRRGC